MKTKIIITVLISLIGFSFNNDKPAYLLYDNSGKNIKYSKMIEVIQEADIVFFGELHTDPISHWLEFEITKDLFAIKKSNLIIGAEMFESDNQVIIDEYLKGLFSDKKFEADSRLWGNYKTDYKPIVEFAKDSGIYFVASNIPRRYASIVHKQGFEGLDGLSDEAKKFIAPLPVIYDPDVNCYKNMLKMLGMRGPAQKKESMKGMMHMKKEMKDSAKAKVDKMPPVPMNKSMMKMSHLNENLPKAQAAKDATMAHFIMKNWEKGKLLIHYNGAYHSENYEGIVWYLNQANNKLNIKTIAVVMQDNVDLLEEKNLDKADFIVCVSSSMTQTNR